MTVCNHILMLFQLKLNYLLYNLNQFHIIRFFNNFFDHNKLIFIKQNIYYLIIINS